MNYFDVQEFFTARIAGMILMAFAAGSVIGAKVDAENHFPTEHKGLDVEQLTVVPEDSMSRQLNLEGRILLARRITIMPGRTGYGER